MDRLKVIKESKINMYDTQNREEMGKHVLFPNRLIVNSSCHSIRKNYLLDDYNNFKLKKNVLNINLNVMSTNRVTTVKDDALSVYNLNKNSNYSINPFF